MTINIEQYALRELQQENELLYADNILKMTQIIDLEQLLYDVRTMDKNGVPCWAVNGCFKSGRDVHSETCIKARQVTEPLWKK